MQKNHTSKTSLKQKIVTWGTIGITGIVGVINAGCYEEQANYNAPVYNAPIKPDLCKGVVCDDVNCYSPIDKSFCVTRQEFVTNWNNSFRNNYKINPNYFINTKPENFSGFPELKENFRIFKIYAIAKLGGASCDANDCSYNGERLSSRKDLTDATNNIYSDFYVSGQTQNIENWNHNLPEVQEHIEKLQLDWIKRNRIRNEIAQLRNQQNGQNITQNTVQQQQPIVQQQQPDLGLQAAGILFQGLGTDIVGFEYRKRN